MPDVSELLPGTERTAGRALLNAIASGAPPPRGYIVNLRLAVSGLEWQPGRVAARLELAEDVCSAPGIVFGGHVAALHDQIAAMVMLSVLPDGVTFVTSRLDTRFLGILRPGHATVEAEVVALSVQRAQVESVIVQHGALTSRSAVTQSLAGAG
ncbi:MAG TPA: PaaI family thioesterase [Actinocrinis sp.]|uniref:PaaI family thioesterase n=1 Tax=Actinocrinis sp. TaxID=1920516 RepID=UPI002DDCACF5|nr:PaaI family thioesterase [Actinocrinis sp.]HEV2343023.1 PaaI family thioesterase [Actinocrinis sp.]